MSYHATSSPRSRHAALQQSIRTVIRRTGTTIGLLGLPGIAFAGPEDGDVVRGAADIINPDPNTTTINQLTDRAVINWQTFNVDADEFVIFNQLDSSSVVLNRVLSSDASYIFGNISANGHVFLLNPHGIFFGEGATLDVQGFLGSTLDIADDDFMAGNYNFTRADNGAALGTVANAGTITAGEGGYVLLAGDVAENTGLITARGGTAALVSGNALTLDLEGDGLVNFAVNEATLASEAGVLNAGSIIADGGMVVMTARVANEVTSTVVNNEGTVRARAIENRGGEIWLVGHGGDVEQSGTLDASGENGDGGQMMVWGDNDVTLHDGGVQTVDGASGHEAGDARFIAQEHLDYQANNLISADGEVGGTVEVSGHGGLNLAGTPTIGPGGELLIDPQWIAITSGGAAPVYSSSAFGWAAGTPLEYQASEDVTLVGTGFISTQLDLGVDVTLVASEAFAIQGSIAPAINASAGSGNLAMHVGSVSYTGTNTFGLGTVGGVFGGSGATITPSADPDPSNIDLSGVNINILGDFTASIAGTSASANISLGNITANNIVVDAGTQSTGAINLGTLNATNNITVTANTINAGWYQTANNVTINGSATGASFVAGSSGATGSINNLTVSQRINVSNQVYAVVNNGGSINVASDILGNGATISAGTAGTVDINGIVGGAGAITLTGGQVNPNARITTTGTVTINGSVGGGSFSIGSSLSAVAGVTINGGVNNTGNVVMYADDISNATINITGDLITTGNVNLNVAGSSGANPSVTIGGYGSAGGNFDITANAGSGGGGSISIGSGVFAGNNVNLTANGTTGFQAGYIDIVAGGISAGGSVNLSATGGSNGGGVINVVGAGPKGIAGNGINITASGTNGQSTGGSAGSVNISGQVQGGTGAVVITTNGTGIGTAGNINISGNGSAGHIRGTSVSITASGVNSGGRIDLGNGAPESSWQGALVTAQTGNVSLTAAAGEGVINAGSITATSGDVIIDNQVGQGHVHIGDYAGGVITGANITAGNNLLATINGSVTAFDVGAVSAGNNLTINLTNGFSHSFGTLNAGGLIDVNLTTVSNFTLGSANGGSIDLNLPAVGLTLGNLNATAGDIFIHGQNVSISDPLVTATGAITLTSDSSFNTFNAFSGSAVTLNFTGPGSGKNITVGDITANSGSIQVLNTNAGGSANLTLGNLDAATSILASNTGAFNVNFSVASTTAGGAVTLRSITSSGNAAINIGSNASAGGNLILDTGFTGATGMGTVTVDGNLNAGGNLSFTSNVDAVSFGTGSHTVTAGSDILMNNNPNLQLTGNAGSANYNAGGNISVSGLEISMGNIVAGGQVNLSGSGTNHSVGNISAAHINAQFSPVADGPIVVDMGTLTANGTTIGSRDVIVAVNGVGGSAGNSSANVTIAGINAQNGQVELRTLNETFNGNGGITITNNISAAGDVLINQGTYGDGFTVNGTVVANNFLVDGSNFTLGGDVTLTGSLEYVGGALNVSGQNITAAGQVEFYTNNSTGSLTFGNIQGSGIRINADGANIVTGALDVINSTGLAFVEIDAAGFGGTGNITVNGGITMSGGVNDFGEGVDLSLITGTTGGYSVTVTGDISLTANPAAYSFSFEGPVSYGTRGTAQMSVMAGDGLVDLGNIVVDAAGEGRISIDAATVTVGDITMDVAGASMNRTNFNPENCFTGCNGTLNEFITNGGKATVWINNDPVMSSTATVTFGNVDITGPDVSFLATGFANISGGGITLAATGGSYQRSSSGTFDSGAESWSLDQTFIGADANLQLDATSTGTVTLGGNVALSGQGAAIVGISGATINVMDVSATASGGTFTRTGSPYPNGSATDGPFGNGHGGGGPRIDEGTINGGVALITIANMGSAADSVAAGNLSVNAMGSARIEILSQTVGAGSITGNATLSTRNGTTSNTFSSGGSTFQESGTVVGSYGDVDVVIENGATVGDVTLGNVTLNGPVAGGHIGGANVTMGDLSFTGTGINLDVNETRTNITAGTSETFVFQGEALITGMGLTAGNSLQVGNIDISGVGAVGTLLSGVNVQTGNVTINVTDANVTAQDASFFGGALTSFTVGNAVFGIDAGTATINGNLDVTAAGIAHIGGTHGVTGDVIINAGRGYDPVIAEEVQFLDSVDDDGSGGNLTLSGPMDVSATNITFVSGSSLDLTPAVLVATGNLTLGANGNLSAGTANFSGHLGASATGSINLVGISSGGASLNIDAGSSINVGSGITVASAASLRASGGAGSIEVAGDVSASSVNIVAAGSGGRVQIGTSTSGVFTGGNVTATAGMINIDAFSSTAGGGHVYAGAVNAAGDLVIKANGQSGTDAGIIRLGNADSTGALTTAAAATAGGNALIDVIAASTGGTIAASSISAGGNLTINNSVLGTLDASGVNLTAGGIINVTGNGTQSFGNLNAEGIRIFTSVGAILTGSLTATNTNGAAFVELETQDASTGTINVGGGITVNGTATSNNPIAAYVNLHAPAFIGTGSVTVSGPISITGAAANYTVSQQSGSETGFVGETNLQVNTGSNGVVSLGSVSINGVTRGSLDVNAAQVTMGDVTATITDGNFSQNLFTSCGGNCSLTNSQTLTSGGFFGMNVGNFSSTGNSATLGNITVSAGDATVSIAPFQNVTGGSINVTGTGFNYTASSTGTLEGSAVNFTQTVTNGGGANLDVQAATGASLGAITLDGAGSARLDIQAGAITTGVISVGASAGTFSISGDPAFGSGGFGDEGTPGPRMDEGTLQGGIATVNLAGFTTGTTGSVAAGNATVNGGITATAGGHAEVFVNANSISVAGNILASATANVIKNGIIDASYVDSVSGDTITETGTVNSSLGGANIDLLGSSLGAVSAGNLTANGASGGIEVIGGDLVIGNVTVTATGGNMSYSSTTTNVTQGTSDSVDFQGPSRINGVQLTATNTVSMGSLNVSGVGAGGALIEGSSVSMGAVSITFTDGNYVITDSDAFGPSANSFTLGDAVFDLNAATASINGNLVVSGTQAARIGGNLNATGSVTISGGIVANSISQEINYLDAIDNDGGSNITLTPFANLAGSVASLSATAGSLDLGSATVTTTVGDLTLNAANAVLTSNATLNVAGSIITNAASLTLGGGSTASYDLVANVGTINLLDVGNVFIDNTANTGTTTLNQTGTVGTLSMTDGGTLTLGTALNADSITLDANDIDLGSNAVTAGGALTFVSGNNVAGSGLLTAGNIVIDALNATTLDLVTSTADLSINGAGALTVDNTAFTGAATMNLNGGSYDSVDASFAGDATLVGGFNAGSANLSVGGSLDLSSTVIAVTNDATVAAGSDIKLTNVDLTTGGNLVVTAGGDIFNAQPPGTITANALSMTAGGSINLPNITFNIGNGSLAGVTGDAELVDLLQDDELSPTSATPNAYFEGTNVSLGTLDMSGDYLYIVSNSLSVTGFTGATDTLIQLVGLDPAAGIGVEDLPANTSTVNYSNSETFAAFAGHSIAVGSTTSTGDILIGENGTIDIGSTNFFAITRGSVTGLSNVLSTGIVKDLDELLGIGFEVPQTDEIDVKQDTFSDLNDDFGHNAGDDLEDNLEEDEEGDEEGEDTDDEVVEEEEDDSLISQDTVEEELMCES